MNVKVKFLGAALLLLCAGYGHAQNLINGHEYVDLGLSVKWATCNVGASSPEECGDYFAWGEISPKDEYTEENSVTLDKNLGDIAGNPQYDAARANWGGTWRMPTADEIKELIDICKWTWTTQGGHNGYKITGPTGNSIFLPAAGFRSGTSLNLAGELGSYWSATPYEGDTDGACSLCFGNDVFGSGWLDRDNGQTVRPVSGLDIELLKKAAEQGDAEAQYCLGKCYVGGYGVPQDYTEAAKWWRKAAEQGDAEAQYCLGECYVGGYGVPQDYTEAAKWWRKAAEQGDAKSQFNLGLCYGKGYGVPEDYTEAVRWLRKAAEQGLAEAIDVLKKLEE